MPGRKIPPSIIGLVAPALACEYSHAQLDSLFPSADAPGDPPDGSKPTKTLEWLRRINRDHPEPLCVLGNLLAEYLDTPYLPPVAPFVTSPDPLAEWNAPRQRIRDALAAEGLTYQRGGHIYGDGLGEPSGSLEEEICKRNIPAVEQEFRRAHENVERDPPAAVTAACAILESLCKTYLEETGRPLPSKLALGPFWDATREGLGLTDEGIADEDLRKILKGLSSIADGVASLRSHAGSAHGRSAAARTRERPFKITARHARLAIHAAHTLALFVLETWTAREDEAKGASNSV